MFWPIPKIQYQCGYKYKLYQDYKINLIKQKGMMDMLGAKSFFSHHLCLFEKDDTWWLWIKKGYCWDGPSGPTIDTKTFMRGSLVHDALYQLIRDGLISAAFRIKADQMLRSICIDDGMNRIRAWYVYHAVRIFGTESASPDYKKPIIEAP